MIPREARMALSWFYNSSHEGCWDHGRLIEDIEWLEMKSFVQMLVDYADLSEDQKTELKEEWEL